MSEVVYRATPTGSAFHKDDNFIRLLMGPLGSGKSVCCCWEIFRRARLQPADSDNKRCTRWVIIRNTYKELCDTTIRTWQEWFPEELGYFNKQHLTNKITYNVGDGTTVELEVLFRALDKPGDIRKLLSLELTGAWINEAREIRKSVLDALVGRIGRFPSRRKIDEYWHGIIMDTNPPDSDHWIYHYFEEIKPTSWSLHRQPSGLSKLAENRANLPKTYYEQMLPGKTQEWINVYVHGKYGFVSDGKLIYPEFNDDVHISKIELAPVPQQPIYVGIDFGLTPAATISQHIDGQWRVIDEVITEDMGTLNFGLLLGKFLGKKYSSYNIALHGDPAGSQRAQTDERTPFEILASQKIMVQPAPSNDFELRREAVASKLMRLLPNGQPALLISPTARRLRKGFNGGYHYRRMQVVGDERYQDVPNKNKYSHVHDALQYAFLGEGEAFELLGYTEDWGRSVNGQY